jgi:arsenate reductase
MSAIEIRAAAPESLALVVDVLRQCDLPHADLAEAHMADFVLAFAADRLVGVAGIERAGDHGLLRSVAVLPPQRGMGVARQLVAACEAHAAALGLRVLVLIAADQTAAQYFTHLGYATATREELPHALLALPEFTHLCPKSMPCLRKALVCTLVCNVADAAVTIYHNPACGTSRNTLAMIRNAGIEPTVIEYLKIPPDRATLLRLIADAGLTVRGALREKCEPYEALGLADPKWRDGELLDFIDQYPILINRPFVVTPLGTRLCRPSEVVLEILPAPQQGAFTKEDGEVVVDAGGRRVW